MSSSDARMPKELDKQRCRSDSRIDICTIADDVNNAAGSDQLNEEDMIKETSAHLLMSATAAVAWSSSLPPSAPAVSAATSTSK